MENSFISKSNINNLYKYVENEVQQKTNTTLDASHKQKFVRLVSTVAKNNKNLNVQQLNNMVVEKSIPFLVGNQNNKQSIRGINSNLKNNIMDRPQSGNISIEQPNNNLNRNMPLNNYNPLLSERPIINSKPNNLVVNENYSKNDVNGLLANLELSHRPTATRNNHINNINNRNKKKDEENYNKFLSKDNNFKSKQQQIEASQEVLFNKMVEDRKQNTKDFIKVMQPDTKNDRKINASITEMYNLSTDRNKPAKFTIDPPDMSNQNIIKENETEINSLLKNDWRQENINKSSNKSLKELYQPQGYANERSQGEMLYIDMRLDSTNGANGGEYISDDTSPYYGRYKESYGIIPLVEELSIDKVSDVYLEFLSMQNISNLETPRYFCLSIDELPIKTYSNNKNLTSKYIIPNETYGKNDTGQDETDDDSTHYNIKLKSNYMTTINPIDISRLTVKFTKGDTDNTLTGTGNITMALYIKKRPSKK